MDCFLSAGCDCLYGSGVRWMEKKYIATLDSKYALGQKLTIPVTINGEHTVWVRAGIELTPYTEPDLDAVRKEAYDEGYKKCLSEHDFDSPCTSCEIEKEAYQKGLDDAWETWTEGSENSCLDIIIFMAL